MRPAPLEGESAMAWGRWRLELRLREEERLLVEDGGGDAGAEGDNGVAKDPLSLAVRVPATESSDSDM